MIGGPKLVDAIQRLASLVEVEAGDRLVEVWLGPKAYDAVSAVFLLRSVVDDERGKWSNGLVYLNVQGGTVRIRRAT